MFTKTELDHILFALNDWNSPASQLSCYVKIRNKIMQIMDKIISNDEDDKDFKND